MQARPTPTSHEHKLGDEEFIVSKTDTTGKITYANRVFMEIAGYSEKELLGVQHNIIRHPDMPRGVFHLVWATIDQRQEFFGFVKNLCKNGSYYWVFANITPDIDRHDQMVGFYSVRRQPPVAAVRTLEPIYREMVRIEQNASSVKGGITRSVEYLQDWLESKGVTYERFVLELYG